MSNSAETVKNVIDLVMKKAFHERKRGEVAYYPYTPNPAYEPYWPGFDFGKVLDQWQEGDVAYVAAKMPGPFERDMVIVPTGDSEVWFNGETPDYYMIGDKRAFPVRFLEGENLLIIKHRAEAERFKFELYIGTPQMPVSWPGGYLYKTRPMVPFAECFEMEGFAWSRAYGAEEEKPGFSLEEIQWAGPRQPAQPENICFDFASRTDYDVACGVSWGNGDIQIDHESTICVYANGEVVYEKETGSFRYSAEEETLFVVEAKRTEQGFGFAVKAGEFRVPLYETEHKDLAWLWLAGVPEVGREVQFKKPYTRVDGSKTFFAYYRQNTYIRPYLNTTFFGQWFYAMMVGHYGMLKMAQRLNMPEYVEYFKDSMGVICDYYEYARYDSKMFGHATFLGTAGRLDNLDAIGTMGMNVWEYVQLDGEGSDQGLLTLLEKSLENVPHTEEGVFYRKKTFWADDFFMSIPFLVRLGGDYWAEAAHHIRGFYDKLYMADKKICSHIYFVEEQKANKVPWGRGNGWVLLALSEYLLYTPKEHPDYADVLAKFRELAEGILSFQGEKGMWHQVIDDHETYEECSGTCMYIIAMARGVKNGWLSEAIVPRLIMAWERMVEVCIDQDGNIQGICVGSGCHMGREYYKKLGACTNDDHGVGIVLLAATEMLDLV